jgi:uncharacterized membrane protein
MGWCRFGAAVAGVGVIAHVGFAYIETFGWGLGLVQNIAPSWLEVTETVQLAEQHIHWAKRLAFNIGVYNLMLAVGLAWTCRAFGIQSAMARPLGFFFGAWMLGAAAAALYTQVFGAFIAQGALGVLLLLASIFAVGRQGEAKAGAAN